MKEQIVVDGLLTSYQIFASNGKKTALFLHGWQSESSAFAKIANNLGEQGVSVYAPDLPGFGQSQAPKSAFGVSEYAQFVKNFIHKLALKDVILIGHSFGGRISIKLAAKNPKLVSKLVLVDSAGIILKDTSKTKAAAKLVKPLFKPKFMQGARRAIYKRLGSSDYLESGKLKETYLKVINEDLRKDLPDIEAPTLLLWGDQDQETPLEIAKIMDQEIKKAKLVTLEGAGHFSFIDQPEQFTKKLLNFINE